jgi:hypothetical protein
MGAIARYFDGNMATEIGHWRRQFGDPNRDLGNAIVTTQHVLGHFTRHRFDQFERTPLDLMLYTFDSPSVVVGID